MVPLIIPMLAFSTWLAYSRSTATCFSLKVPFRISFTRAGTSLAFRYAAKNLSAKMASFFAFPSPRRGKRFTSAVTTPSLTRILPASSSSAMVAITAREASSSSSGPSKKAKSTGTTPAATISLTSPRRSKAFNTSVLSSHVPLRSRVTSRRVSAAVNFSSLSTSIGSASAPTATTTPARSTSCRRRDGATLPGGVARPGVGRRTDIGW